MPDKLDLAKLYKQDYVAPKKPVLLEIPKATYLVIEGQGAPGGDAFSEAIGALYAMAYTIKMTRKFGGEQDYSISKLEAQYWAPGEQTCFTALPKEQWCWGLMIRTPEFVKKAELTKALAALREKGRGPGAERVTLQTLKQGRCVQMLHIGPYDREGKTMEVMVKFAAEQGFELHGRHHEIYLSDPRRVAPEKLKTILRSQVRRATK